MFNKTIKYTLNIAKTLALAAIISTSVQYTAKAEKIELDLIYDGATHHHVQEEVKLLLNGQPFTPKLMPVLLFNSTTFIPVKEVFEYMGAVVDWNAATSEIYIAYNNQLIIMKPNSTEINVDGEIRTLRMAPKIINNRTLIPLGQAAEALGFDVNWIPSTRTAVVNSADYIMPEDTPIEDTSTEPVTDPNLNMASDIAEQVHPETDIIGIITPSEPGNETFAIHAKSAISKVQTIALQDNRVVIDIYNSRKMISETKYDTPLSSCVSAVRIGQNQVTPVKITRVVFDRPESGNFEVSISEDRTIVFVSFAKNNIGDISFAASKGSDLITIEATSSPVVNVYTLTNPDRVVADINFSRLGTEPYELPSEGTYASNLRIGQFNENTVRLVIDLHTMPTIATRRNGTKFEIELYTPEYNCISYVKNSHSVIVLDKSTRYPLNIKQIQHQDNYHKREYILTLPGDYSDVYGRGTLNINDENLNSVEIRQNTDGNTELVISEVSIKAFDISEDANNIYIKTLNPKEKYPKIVLLDAGHGLQDPGTTANGLYEKVLNLEVMLKLYNELNRSGKVKVYATRLEDTYPQNIDRAKLGNEIADMFVSIHHNSAPPTSNGTKVLYFNHEADAKYGITSQEIATMMEKAIVDRVATRSGGLENRPDLIVLNSINIPAVLVEVVFQSNLEDAARAVDPVFQQNVAEAMSETILQIFNDYPMSRN